MILLVDAEVELVEMHYQLGGEENSGVKADHPQQEDAVLLQVIVDELPYPLRVP